MRKMILIVLTLLLVGCGSSSVEAPVSIPATATVSISCSKQAENFIIEMDSILARWDDANELAGSTPRAALSPAIGDLQEIRREASGFESPDCVALLHFLLIDYMDRTIDGYLAFLSSEEDITVQGKFLAARYVLDKFMAEYARLEVGEGPYDNEIGMAEVPTCSQDEFVTYMEATAPLMERYQAVRKEASDLKNRGNKTIYDDECKTFSESLRQVLEEWEEIDLPDCLDGEIYNMYVIAAITAKADSYEQSWRKQASAAEEKDAESIGYWKLASMVQASWEENW